MSSGAVRKRFGATERKFVLELLLSAEKTCKASDTEFVLQEWISVIQQVSLSFIMNIIHNRMNF